MEIAMNLGYYKKTATIKDAASALSNAGIKLLDYTPEPNATQEAVDEALRVFDETGLRVYQCHAPFNRYGGYGNAENHKHLLAESLDFAEIFGAKYLVVHGDEFDFDTLQYSSGAALEYNYEYFAPLIDAAAKKGIYIAFENVFEDSYDEDKGKVKPRFCSNPEDLITLIEKFDNEYVCCCWDFGHGAVQLGEKFTDSIRMLGKKIQCTHVHDNYFDTDAHLVPFMGEIDWKKSMNALKQTSCEVLSLELVYGYIPPIILPTHAKMLAQVGDELNKLLK